MSIIEPEGKATTRSFRIDKAWDEALLNQADKKSVSISSLLEKIVRDYLLFYRWVEDLGSLVFAPNTIMEIINALDEEKLSEIAERVARVTFIESYLARGDDLSLETVMFQIKDQMGRYANWFTVIEHETDAHYFYIRHNYGEKWSCFVESYIYTLLNSIAGADIVMERVGGNILVKIDSD